MAKIDYRGSVIDAELRQVVEDVKRNAELAVNDINYRIDSGIYTKPWDRTAADVWADLKVAQNSEPWDMFSTFVFLDELKRRGQIFDY
jgi:hypothetical protein